MKQFSLHSAFIRPLQVTEDENRKGTAYKIGDLGMVSKISDPKVEEGDVRYLPKELIADVCSVWAFSQFLLWVMIMMIRVMIMRAIYFYNHSALS